MVMWRRLLRRIGLGAAMLLMAGLLTAASSASPEPVPPPSAPAADVEASPHGGGGFALLLLDYRHTLERLIMTLEIRRAQIADGLRLLPEELRAAALRVTGGGDGWPTSWGASRWSFRRASGAAGSSGAGFIAASARRFRTRPSGGV